MKTGPLPIADTGIGDKEPTTEFALFGQWPPPKSESRNWSQQVMWEKDGNDGGKVDESEIRQWKSIGVLQYHRYPRSIVTYQMANGVACKYPIVRNRFILFSCLFASIGTDPST